MIEIYNEHGQVIGKKKTRADEELKKYDKVLTVKTAIGEVPVYKFIEKFLKIQDKV